MEQKKTTGHFIAMLTIILWGTTFISTKVLLEEFLPIEILFTRFVMGFIALLLVNPRCLKWAGWKQERLYIGAGLCGVCLYYLLENTALTYSLASNVGVITSSAPFFTAVVAHIFLKKEEKLGVNFFVGFLVAMIGIGLISFNGMQMSLNPKGDILAIAAAITWAFYSILTKKISAFGYSTILTTRRVFFYGILFMIPILLCSDCTWSLERFADPVYVFNFIFLGLGASAACFVSWNYAVKLLGAVKTSVYIYLIPVITVVASIGILHEKVTLMAGAGIAFTLAGLVLSEVKLPRKKNCEA